MGQRGMFAFSGGAFAENYGPYGAYVMTGGGHNDYHGNEIYVFPFHDRKWVRLTDPYPSNGLGKGRYLGAPPTRSADITRYWPNFDMTYGDYDGSIPPQMHTYDFVDVLPANAGGGSAGSFIRLIGTAVGRAGGVHFGGTHTCDLATGRWSRYALCDYAGVAGGSAYDAKRKRFYLIVAGGTYGVKRLRFQTPLTGGGRATLPASYRSILIRALASTRQATCCFVRSAGPRRPAVWAIPLDSSMSTRWTRLTTTTPGPFALTVPPGASDSSSAPSMAACTRFWVVRKRVCGS
jgi:hypothetical protein